MDEFVLDNAVIPTSARIGLLLIYTDAGWVTMEFVMAAV